MRSFSLLRFSQLCFVLWLGLWALKFVSIEIVGEVTPLLDILSFVVGCLVFSSALYNWFRARSLEDDRILLLRELADLLRCDIPLDQAFEALAASRKRTLEHRFAPFTVALSQAAAKASWGTDLPEIFSSSKLFPKHWGVIAEQGQARGDLPETLDSLAAIEEVRFQLPVSSLVRIGLVFPSLIGMATFLSVYIMPTYSALLEGYRVSPHWTTSVVNSLNDQSFSGFVLFLLGVFTSLVMLSLIFPATKNVLKRVTYLLPGFRQVHKCEQQARAFQVLAITLKQGLPLATALAQAREAATLKCYAKSFEIKPGSGLSEVLRTSPKLFDKSAIWLIEQGEAFENLPEALEELAEAFRLDYQRQLHELEIKIDTIFLAALGIFCGVLAVGFFRAYVDILEAMVNGIVV